MSNKNKKRIVPIFTLISFSALALSLLTYIAALNSRSAADFINSTASVAVRFMLARITSLVYISLFELILVLLIPAVILLVIISALRSDTALARIRTVFYILGVIAFILSSYVFTLGVGYQTTPIAERIGISDDPDISTDELYDTIMLVRNEINELSASLTLQDGETHMPYSFASLSNRIIDAYEDMNNEYGIVSTYSSRAKPVIMSSLMSDLRITGIYSFPTGEANINMSYPDYMLPFTVAHEFAHQRGICRENEANFVAFLVCIASDDAYIRYSGYLNLYEYLASALYSADKERYKDVIDGLSETAKSDMRASNEVYRQHEDSILGEINEWINDRYLKANGTAGTVSYGYVVRLAVSYYKNRE